MIATVSSVTVTGRPPDEDGLHGRPTPASGDGDDAPPPTPGERLAANYERSRRSMHRFFAPVLCPDFNRETMLDRCDPEALSEAADLILRDQAAREVIRAAARLEQAIHTSHRNSHNPRAFLADEMVVALERERDRASRFMYEVRKSQAAQRKLEAAAKRAEAKLSAPGPAPYTPTFARPPDERDAHVAPGADNPGIRAVVARPAHARGRLRQRGTARRALASPLS